MESPMQVFSEKRYRGKSVSPGLGEGIAYVMGAHARERRDGGIWDPAVQKERFYQARERFCMQIMQQANRLHENICKKDAEILLLQQTLALDTGADREICSLLDQGCCAEAAVDQVWTKLRNCVPDRSEDFEDVRLGLLHALGGSQSYGFLEVLPEKTVLIAKDLSPAMVSHLHPQNVTAVLCEEGGILSHGAILIRAMGIPCIMHVPEILTVPSGTDMLCDASAGRIIAAPRPTSRVCFYKSAHRLPMQDDTKKTLTFHGKPIQILCNISSAAEAEAGIRQGAEGVGLLRTEILWASGMPDEEIQFLEYKKAASCLAEGQPLCIRALDPSGDKTPELYTGQRGIRYCLTHREQFQIQLCAVLRAAAEYSCIRLLLPMVTDADEVKQTRQLLQICRKNLIRRGYKDLPMLSVGVMIETPAAVLIADRLAAAADFFSIGSGDLTQYIMACSRSKGGENLYAALPVLRAIRHAAAAAKNAGIPCHFCGEAAGNPHMPGLLLSYGISSFSVCPPMIPRLRWELTRIQEKQRQGSKSAVDEKFIKTY